MKKIIFWCLFFLVALGHAQTKVSGIVTDAFGNPVAFANVLFQDSMEGTITNDNGRFYLESENDYTTLAVSFVGYDTKVISLNTKVTYTMKIALEEATEQY